MKNRIVFFIVIFVTGLSFSACDELGGTSKPSNKTLAFFAFNDNTLDTMQRYDGTAVGSPSYVSGQGTETSPRAMELNGTTQYVDVADLTQSFDGDFSAAAWVYLPDLPGAGVIFPVASKGPGSTGAEFALYINSSGNLSCLLGNGSGGYEVSTTGGPINADTWHYVALTVENNEVTLYVDPTAAVYTAAASGTSFSGTRVAGSASLQVGRYHDGSTENFFDGIIDQVRIANYAYHGYGLGVIHDEED